MTNTLWVTLEERLTQYLSGRQETEPMYYHRFYDTRSAGNFLPAQPADHMVISRGRPILIECKHSIKHKSLTSCFSGHVTNGQIASHRLWLRANGFGFVLFCYQADAKADRHYELWRSEDLIWARRNSKRLKKTWISRTFVAQGKATAEELSPLFTDLPAQVDRGSVILL